jgi:hypothetical protein
MSARCTSESGHTKALTWSEHHGGAQPLQDICAVGVQYLAIVNAKSGAEVFGAATSKIPHATGPVERQWPMSFQGPSRTNSAGKLSFRRHGNAQFVLCDAVARPDVPRTEQPNFNQCMIVPRRNGDEEGE